MDEADAYQELRPLLFSIAYRMVGSASEAEDLVQEAYLRFHRAVSGGADVESPKAYLSAVTTRLAIDHLRSARARRHVEAGRPRFEASRRQREELARRFFAAVDQGDTEGLVGLLAADAVLHGDGGGKAPALAAPLHGAERIARFLLGLARRGRAVGMRFAPAEI